MWVGALALIALVAGAVVVGTRANAAATNKYTFTARGIVREVNLKGSTLRLYVQYTSTNAEKDLLGQTQDFNVNGAKFYKWVNGKKTRVTYSKMAQVGDEVAIKGVAKSNDEYKLSEATKNDRSFSVIGKLHNYNANDRTMQITVTSSTYKSATYVGKDVWMQYGDSAKFKGGNKSDVDINSDDVKANEQKVKVTGVMEGNNWVVYNFYDNYKKAQ